MAQCLVTGGAGFIGSHIVDALVAAGHTIVILDDLSSGHTENLAHHGDRVRLERGSILDSELVDKVMEGVEYVFHEAAIPSVPRSVEDPVGTYSVNVTGMLTVLDAARRHGVKRFVYASSSAVYGDDPELPKHEGLVCVPKSPYALHKYQNEQYARMYSALYGLPTVGLRYFNVFGPRQDPRSEYSGVISIFITRALRGEPVTIFGDGAQTRDFVSVHDVVRANLAALTLSNDVSGVCNVARGDAVTLNALYTTVSTLVDTARAPGYGVERAGDIRHSSASISHAQEMLGYEPQTTFEEGLRETIAYYRHAG